MFLFQDMDQNTWEAMYKVVPAPLSEASSCTFAMLEKYICLQTYHSLFLSTLQPSVVSKHCDIMFLEKCSLISRENKLGCLLQVKYSKIARDEGICFVIKEKYLKHWS